MVEDWLKAICKTLHIHGQRRDVQDKNEESFILLAMSNLMFRLVNCDNFALRFLFYMINPGEGFNLRRDVYMRIAIMVKQLNEKSDNAYTLVRTYSKSCRIPINMPK